MSLDDALPSLVVHAESAEMKKHSFESTSEPYAQRGASNHRSASVLKPVFPSIVN